MSKNVEMKTVNIKGQDYVTVAERVKAFHKLYPQGQITSDLISEPNANRIVFKSVVDLGDDRVFTGYAAESIGDGFINKSAAMENAETSAVGRALGFAGIGIVDSVASVDEIDKAKTASKNPNLNKPTNDQKKDVAELMHQLDIVYSPDNAEEWTSFCMEAIGVESPNNREQADQLIAYMQDKILDKEAQRVQERNQ